MNNAKARSDKYATTNTEPTMTDQSGAADTDINLIVKRYGVFGQAPGAATEPVYGDFADLPIDLREKIELIRSIPQLQRSLPEQLATRSLQDLASLTNEQLTAILQPVVTPAPTPAPTEPKATT